MEKRIKELIVQGILFTIVCWVGTAVLIYTKHADGSPILVVGGIIFPIYTVRLYVKLRAEYPYFNKRRKFKNRRKRFEEFLKSLI